MEFPMKKSRLLSVLLCLALLSGLLATFASAADSGSAILDEMDVNAKAAVLVDPEFSTRRTPTRTTTPPPSPR